MTVARVILRPKRAQPFFARHPWVFAGAIERVEGAFTDGDEVDLITHGDTFVARGLINDRSKIRVRLFSWNEGQSLDRAFFRSRLEAAIRLRYQMLNLDVPDGGCRLVASEGDGLSGCTVDRYGQWLVLQLTSLGLANRREMIAELLVELLQPKGIYLRTERGIGQLEGLELHDGPLWGEVPPADLIIVENGLQYRINLPEGQKTGTYLDQRENRAAVAKLAHGRTMLDAFCYSGGFSLNAAKAGATQIEAVDSSEAALKLAVDNAHLNHFENISFVKADVFVHLEKLVNEGRKFGVVVLDPPKFARSKNAIDEALRGYRRLQSFGVRLLEPDGVLVTCCCSGLITPMMLEEVLAQVAVSERRNVQILERRGAAADHPIAVTCPESGYLKCLIARVG